MNNSEIQIDMTETEIIEWLCDLAIDDEDLPGEIVVTIATGRPEDQEEEQKE